MMRNRLARMLGGATALILFGCREGEPDSRLLELAVNVEKQDTKVEQVARKVEEIETRLDEIQASLRETATSVGHKQAAEKELRPVTDFRDTLEYKRIAAALSAIQQRLQMAESGPVNAKEEMANALELFERRKAVRQFNQRLRTIYNPQQMREGLNTFVENFAKDMDDLRRQEFHADVEQLRQINSEELSQEELYERLVSNLRERLNTVQDERFREWIQRELTDMESASSDELSRVVEECRCFHNFLRMRELADKYQISRVHLGGIPQAPWEE